MMPPVPEITEDTTTEELTQFLRTLAGRLETVAERLERVAADEGSRGRPHD
jgi:hypothetical protein